MHTPVTQSSSTQEIVDRSEICFRHLPGAKANLHSRNRTVLCSVLEHFPKCLGLIWKLKYAQGMLPAELKDSVINNPCSLFSLEYRGNKNFFFLDDYKFPDIEITMINNSIESLLLLQ